MLSQKDLESVALQLLGLLPPEAPIVVTLRAGDLVGVLQQRLQTGARIITTEQAAEAFGYTEDRWRRWAGSGKIEGAYQHSEGAPWRLPRAACEQLLSRLKGERIARKAKHRARGPRRRSVPEVLPSSRTDIVSIDDARGA